MKEGRINERWSLMLTEDRVAFHDARPTWEASRLAHMFDRVEDGMVVFDVGAESGDFTALYRGWVGSGDVVPVEPSLPYWPSIRQTWEANGFPAPAATFSGFASYETADAPGAPGMTAFEAGWPAWSIGEVQPDFGFRHLAQDTARTPQITLSDLAQAAFVPDVIVLDIEGAEYDVIRGAADLIAEAKPLVYISVHPPTMLAWYEHTEDDLRALLDFYGYGNEYLGTHGGEDFWFAEAR